MDVRRRQPMGVELVKRGIVNEEAIEEALTYQREHPNQKIGDILYIHENECMDLTINYSVKQGIYMYESTLTMHFKGVKHL